MKSLNIYLRNDATTIRLIGRAIVKPFPKHVATLLRCTLHGSIVTV